MTRTPDQVAADDALSAAVEQVLQAYDDGDAWILTEYVGGDGAAPVRR